MAESTGHTSQLPPVSFRARKKGPQNGCASRSTAYSASSSPPADAQQDDCSLLGPSEAHHRHLVYRRPLEAEASEAVTSSASSAVQPTGTWRRCPPGMATAWCKAGAPLRRASTRTLLQASRAPSVLTAGGLVSCSRWPTTMLLPLLLSATARRPWRPSAVPARCSWPAAPKSQRRTPAGWRPAVQPACDPRSQQPAVVPGLQRAVPQAVQPPALEAVDAVLALLREHCRGRLAKPSPSLVSGQVTLQPQVGSPAASASMGQARRCKLAEHSILQHIRLAGDQRIAAPYEGTQCTWSLDRPGVGSQADRLRVTSGAPCAAHTNARGNRKLPNSHTPARAGCPSTYLPAACSGNGPTPGDCWQEGGRKRRPMATECAHCLQSLAP